jgi:hypothetical protein
LSAEWLTPAHLFEADHTTSKDRERQIKNYSYYFRQHDFFMQCLEMHCQCRRGRIGIRSYQQQNQGRFLPGLSISMSKQTKEMTDGGLLNNQLSAILK